MSLDPSRDAPIDGSTHARELELFGALSLPESAREELRAALAGERAARVVTVRADARASARLDGLACVARVPSTAAAYDIAWFLVRPGQGAVERARRLLARVGDEVAKDGAAMLRFVGAQVHRGFADAHLLDAAGFERRGRVAGFYGPDDDLLLYTAVVASDAQLPFDPTLPAALYDAAFAYRDFAAERDFLLACAREHGARAVRRVASWGCGSGRHLQAFADLGIDGIGLDEDPEQLELAARLHATSGARAQTTWIVAPADASPSLVDLEPVDLSFAMLSTCHRLASDAAIVAWLRATSALLAPGGVHVIEATHPGDLDHGRARTIAWTELRDGFSIQSRFRLQVESTAEDGLVPAILDVRCREQDGGKVVGVLQQHERWLVPDGARWVDLVARAGGFEIAALLGDFQLDVAWDQPGAWRLLVVLRRV